MATQDGNNSQVTPTSHLAPRTARPARSPRKKPLVQPVLKQNRDNILRASRELVPFSETK